MRNASALLVWMPYRIFSSHLTRLGSPPFLSAQGSCPILSVACVVEDRLRHSTALHEMTPMIFGMDIMGASSVNVHNVCPLRMASERPIAVAFCFCLATAIIIAEPWLKPYRQT